MTYISRKLYKNEYPLQLRQISQLPESMDIVGEMPGPENIFLCVVGSRKFDSYGIDACKKIISGLKGYPIVIVSGFAMGIDTIAHKKAMQTGLKTIVFNLGIDASCSTTTHYACASGDDDSNSNFWDGSSHTWTWSCLGQNGGTNQSCSLAFNPANCAPAELIDPPTNIPCYCSNSANISAAVCLKRPGYIEN